MEYVGLFGGMVLALLVQPLSESRSWIGSAEFSAGLFLPAVPFGGFAFAFSPMRTIFLRERVFGDIPLTN